VRPVSRRLLAGVAAAVLAASLAACAGNPRTRSAEEVSLTADVKRSNNDQVRGQVRVGLRNDGDEPVAVEQLRLDAPPFDPPVVRPRTEVLQPGQRVDVRVEHGEPDCSGNPQAVQHARAVVRVSGADGGRDVPVDVAGSDATLDPLLRLMCGEQALARLVDITFTDGWESAPDGRSARGVLEIRRRPGADRPPVALVDVAGSVIFAVRPLSGAREPVATLAADQDVLSVPVSVGGGRCDPHALLESKKTYVFADRKSVV
jgi:hypothetical protein